MGTREPGDDELRLLSALFRAGKLKHVGDLPRETGFNLGVSCNRFDCNTVACIGGWQWLIANPGDVKGALEYVERILDEDDDLEILFVPQVRSEANWPDGRFYSDVTPLMAADAIDAYLETGSVDWTEIFDNHA